MRPRDQDEHSKLTVTQHIQSFIAVIGGVGGAAFIYLSGWESLSIWGQRIVLGLISVLIIIYIFIPTFRYTKKQVATIRKKRKQHLILQELVKILSEARRLYDANLNCSIKNYVHSFSNQTALNHELQIQFLRMDDRLQILSNWHYSLLNLLAGNLKKGFIFDVVVWDIIRFYRDTADVVSELASIKFWEDGSVRVDEQNRRMMGAKYNSHIGELERVIEKIKVIDSSFQCGEFHRF